MHKVNDDLRELLQMALSTGMINARIDDWKMNLESSELNEEALRVFIALGWITPRDPRIVKHAK